MSLFSHSVMSDSLRLHGLQHARLLCPSPSSRACSNSCPLSRWCHRTVSSSVIPLFSYFQYFPAPGSFPMSQLFITGGQRIGASASASVLPMHIQHWLVWSCSPRDSQESSPIPQLKSINSSVFSLFYSATLTSIHMVLFSVVAVWVYTLTNSARGLPFLHTLSSNYCVQLFGNGHSEWCGVILHCSLISLFLLFTDVGSPFMFQWLLKPCSCMVLSHYLSSNRQTWKTMEHIYKNIHIPSL